ncbi:flagellar motor protein MotB [Bosea caraganae]|uniref:Flagellar motor protein MotB n=1 Tax=Bosea caraganae TaxID=2763117 RepID=A0A370KZN2_9HYPH|nr:OmpA family protein [Bosea caraganae]RDJ20458.1 flagellar motor protein MotB [Bosea caraganae]RDJ29973.1 flagellar motor protein MotB [Bosea caraganae]
MKRLFAAGLLALVSITSAWADATIPTKDIPGAKDSPLLKRYDGSFIVSYERVAFTDFKVPLSALEPVDKRDSSNNILHLPKQEKEVEGSRTRLVYLLPAERSPLEVLRNYQDEVEAISGSVLFSCKGEGCGGDAQRSSSGGGGESSLLMYFVREGDLKEPSFSNGACALTTGITDQRFFSAKLPHPDGEAYVTVQTYQVSDELYCKAFNGRTVAVVHIVEPRPRDRKMTTVKAEEMARSIDATGRIALYGIFFDTDKAELKTGSEPALTEIAALLKTDPKLAVLIVGHTDNQGSFDYNVELSRKRADAVVKALVATHKIDAKRLRAAGAGMIAPAAANDADSGRAKNRRVEVVKLN